MPKYNNTTISFFKYSTAVCESSNVPGVVGLPWLSFLPSFTSVAILYSWPLMVIACSLFNNATSSSMVVLFVIVCWVSFN